MPRHDGVQAVQKQSSALSTFDMEMRGQPDAKVAYNSRHLSDRRVRRITSQSGRGGEKDAINYNFLEFYFEMYATTLTSLTFTRHVTKVVKLISLRVRKDTLSYYTSA